MASRRWFVSFVLLAVCRGERLSARLHGDAIFDVKSVVSEVDRAARFLEVHGSWPDPNWVKREQPSYTKAMALREARAMELTSSQDRWDAWMHLAQARLLSNFTEKQYEVVRAPQHVYAKLIEHFRSNANKTRRETNEDALSGVYGPNPADFVEQEALNYWVLDELKPLHEAWAGVELEATSVYGVRIYRDGATLVDHLDVPETHVISSILHIDSSLLEPFPIEIQDASGAYAGVDLKPGQMMFYESAKCYHRRSKPMRGSYYGSVFLHYRPKNWTFGRDQIRHAVPPFWGDGLEREAVVEAPFSADVESHVTFRLVGDGAVQLVWLPADGTAPVRLAALDVGDREAAVHTFVGHRFGAMLIMPADDKRVATETLVATFTVDSAAHIFTVDASLRAATSADGTTPRRTEL
ncbi:hypothetical protein M885DRAFT_617409 [Pelagophyceae sp. CCMP2097]|nr:hypothetical protein M885DRAFT_617409 [Pelagophyceae sp. CCMP2097]